uniref:Uncharacterized protein n=2 Tax=Arion vulgaris TaxID=1028688 RepID=A0A0B6YZB6_9EUPU
MVSKYRDILEPPSPSVTPTAAATPGSKEGSDTDSTHVNKMDGGESSDDLTEREAEEEEEEKVEETVKDKRKR